MSQHCFINLWELEFQMNSEFQEMSTFIMCITMRVLQSLCFNVKSNYCTIIEKRSNIQFQTTFTWVFSTLKVVTYNFIHLSLFKIFAIHYIFSQQQNNVLLCM